MRRRDFIAWTSVAAASSALGGCSPRPRPPKGWKRISAGQSSFYVPDNWKQVSIPDDAILAGWDWVMQDTSSFRDKSATCRVLVMSHGVDPVIHNPPKDDTKLMARLLSQTELFGGGTAVGINDSPYQVKGAPDQLWRMDYREEIDSTKVTDHVFLGQDDGEPELAIIGLTGPGITEELLKTFATGIEVNHD